MFEAARRQPLDFAAWLDSPAAATWRELWLGPVGAERGSVVALTGVRDTEILRRAAEGLPGVQWVDRVADISTVLRHYRHKALLALGGALAAIGAVLMLRYGPASGLRHLIAPLGGGLLTLATLGLLGVPATLFTVLALAPGDPFGELATNPNVPPEVQAMKDIAELERLGPLADPDFVIKALKTEQWSARWTTASLRMFNARPMESAFIGR